MFTYSYMYKYSFLFVIPLRLKLWVQERLPMAMSQEHGSTLQAVQQLMKKNQVRKPK